MDYLTLRECRTIIESLIYSKQKVSDYRHPTYQCKLLSLKPIEETLRKVRTIRDEIKKEIKSNGEEK